MNEGHPFPPEAERMIKRANRLEDKLRVELRAYSFARVDLAAAIREALCELRSLDRPDKAIKALERVEKEGLLKIGWTPPVEP